jgi:hypothetical protein
MKHLSFLVISTLFLSCSNQTETIKTLEVKIDSLETVIADLEALPTIEDLKPVFIPNSQHIKLGEEFKGFFCLALVDNGNPATVFRIPSDLNPTFNLHETEKDTINYYPERGLHIFKTIPDKKGVVVEHFKMIKKFEKEKKVYALEIEYEVD